MKKIVQTPVDALLAVAGPLAGNISIGTLKAGVPRLCSAFQNLRQPFAATIKRAAEGDIDYAIAHEKEVQAGVELDYAFIVQASRLINGIASQRNPSAVDAVTEAALTMFDTLEQLGMDSTANTTLTTALSNAQFDLSKTIAKQPNAEMQQSTTRALNEVNRMIGISNLAVSRNKSFRP